MYFVKLFSTITTSSISDEDVHVRWVWIVCLTLCDKNGNFHATTTSLARLANIPLDQVEEAMEILCAPDPKSTSQENEGRRIERVSTNEWHVFNFTRYKSLRDPDEVREKTRERVAKHRTKGSNVTHVTKCNTQVTESNDNIEIDIEFPADAAGDEVVVSATNSYQGENYEEYKKKKIIQAMSNTSEPTQWEENDSWMEDDSEDSSLDQFIEECIGEPLEEVPENEEEPESFTDDDFIQIMFDTHNYLATEHHGATPDNNNLIKLTWEQLQQSDFANSSADGEPSEVDVLRHIATRLMEADAHPVVFTQFYFEKFHNSNNTKLPSTDKGVPFTKLAGRGFPSRKWLLKNHDKLITKFLDTLGWTSRLYTSPEEEVLEVGYGY